MATVIDLPEPTEEQLTARVNRRIIDFRSAYVESRRQQLLNVLLGETPPNEEELKTIREEYRNIMTILREYDRMKRGYVH